ncbi:MAG: fructosamine kinase family protein [Candidatus Zixiibacteriota bacterium]|nr:MAG: fructosamine kinase family protein [candidate division Zixibacteria bacterium]
MNNDNNYGIPQVRYGPIKWLGDTLRVSIEEAVTKNIRREWKIKTQKDLSEFAYHRCAIVSDNSFYLFFKYSEAADAGRQFEIEISDLQTLSEKAGVLIPHVIEIIQVENGWILIMKALEAIQRGPRQWREIGATLARIHRVKGEYFGFETDGFWGPLHQDNTPTRDWETFFRERRLLPLLKIGIDSGNIPSSVVSDVETLITRLPDLCGPEITPSLLHGDAQQNNFISTSEGAYVIDPAVYYGNPEMDLALIDSFQPVPDDVFDSYREEMPIDPGFYERRYLWRIPLYLAAVALEGPMHLNRLTGALGRYL